MLRPRIPWSPRPRLLGFFFRRHPAAGDSPATFSCRIRAAQRRARPDASPGALNRRRRAVRPGKPPLPGSCSAAPDSVLTPRSKGGTALRARPRCDTRPTRLRSCTCAPVPPILRSPIRRLLHAAAYAAGWAAAVERHGRPALGGRLAICVDSDRRTCPSCRSNRRPKKTGVNGVVSGWRNLPPIGGRPPSLAARARRRNVVLSHTSEPVRADQPAVHFRYNSGCARKFSPLKIASNHSSQPFRFEAGSSSTLPYLALDACAPSGSAAHSCTDCPLGLGTCAVFRKYPSGCCRASGLRPTPPRAARVS